MSFLQTFAVTHKHVSLWSCSKLISRWQINQIWTFDQMGYKIERMGRLVLQTRVFFLLLHMFKSHVGAQEAFFSKLPAAMRDSDSGLSPSPLSPAAHNKMKMSWSTGKWAFSYAAVSKLINCCHEKIVKSVHCVIRGKWRCVYVCVCVRVGEGGKGAKEIIGFVTKRLVTSLTLWLYRSLW